MRRPRPQPWLNDIKFRLRFERGLKTAFAGVSIRTTGRGLSDEAIYKLTVPVKGYEQRKVTIRIKNGYQPVPRVFVDGPEDSPHRYSDRSLCMWDPRDPPEMKWVAADGLLTLLRYVQLHLFREAWWRETGEWLGEQSPHAGPDEKDQ